MKKPYLRKRGQGWEITYYHPKTGDRKYLSLPPGTPKQISEARRDRIAIREHKLGIQEFTLGEQPIDTILCGPFGAAVMYLAPSLQSELEPGLAGFRVTKICGTSRRIDWTN